jgi:Leucine-rich repeat (LRR) protein
MDQPVEVKLPVLGNFNNNSFSYNLRRLVNLDNEEIYKKILNQAVKAGFLIYPTIEFLLDIYQSQSHNLISKKRENLMQLIYLNLNGNLLIDIGDIDLCTNLTILILSDNYLTNIEPLRNCINILRLDLQNNHVNC